ncbi:MAG: glycoside hydrolase family 97 N-terminal domain-containing protein, partial [Rikenellaceae bacterium]
MKKLFLSLTLLVAIMAQAFAAEPQTLTSPNGDFEFTFNQVPLSAGGNDLIYSVSFRGEQIVKDSKLGVEVKNKLIEL